MGTRRVVRQGFPLWLLVTLLAGCTTTTVDEFRQGKDRAFNALVGMVMKASKGKANPQQAGELLRRKLTG